MKKILNKLGNIFPDPSREEIVDEIASLLLKTVLDSNHNFTHKEQAEIILLLVEKYRQNKEFNIRSLETEQAELSQEKERIKEALRFF